MKTLRPQHGTHVTLAKGHHVSLSERLSTPPAPKGAQSSIDRWMAGLNETDRAAVIAAINNPDWRHTDLQAILEAEGAPKVADTTFGVWRRKQAAT